MKSRLWEKTMCSMSIGKKIFWCFFILFFIAINIIGNSLINYNYETLLKNEVATTKEQYKFICLIIEDEISKFNNEMRNSNLQFKKSKITVPIYLYSNVRDKLIYFINSSTNSNTNIEITDRGNNVIFTNRSFYEIDYHKNGYKHLSVANEKDKFGSITIRGVRYIEFTNSLDTMFGRYEINIWKNISYIDEIKKEQCDYFNLMKIIFMSLLTIIILIIIKQITKPIEILRAASTNIIKGDYSVRVDINTKDEIGYLAARFNDMTRRIEESMKELKENAQSKQEFMDNLTHELKTPLTSIVGYSSLIRGSNYDGKFVKKSIDNIYFEGKRMENLIEKMSRLTMLESSDLNKSNVNIKEFFNKIERIMGFKLKENSIKLEINFVDKYILVDEILFEEVIINLIDNAIKASKPGDTITLGAEIGYNKRSIYVKDNGSGIAEEEVEKIMEPFYRIDKSRSRELGGVGLGMYICHKIIELHKGKLKIKSILGEGTTIEVVL